MNFKKYSRNDRLEIFEKKRAMFVGMKKINPGINNKYFWIDALSFFFLFFIFAETWLLIVPNLHTNLNITIFE